MAGIAGIAECGRTEIIEQALHLIVHRGSRGTRMFECGSATLGDVGGDENNLHQASAVPVVFDGAIFGCGDESLQRQSVGRGLWDLYTRKGPDFVSRLAGPFALAIANEDGLFLARDPLGVAPLYYGFSDGIACFASEVKSLLGWAEDIKELPPGHYFLATRGVVCYSEIEKVDPLDIAASDAADGLRSRLAGAVARRISWSDSVGCWLSGGLDSSAITALASLQVPGIHTFAVGMAGAEDLDHARAVARSAGTHHHEWVASLEDMLDVLPQVIYHLESFDALLVRSSVMNFMAGKMASDHVSSVLSGEGGDELFAGYEYLKGLDPSLLADELVDITRRLHNTALQRVDRCSSAHGIVAHTPFLDMDVVHYALSVPVDYKIYRNGGIVEKWILRKAMEGLLPESVLNRPKAKFWEGAGVTDAIERHATGVVSDSDFAKERSLPGGDILNTKEELFYYRVFRDHFGEVDDLSFVGRTKGAPVH